MMEYNAIYDPLSTRRNEKDEWDTAKTDRICIVRKNPIFATRSSEEEHRVDALALRADERRDKLR